MARIDKIWYEAGMTLPTVSFGNSKITFGSRAELTVDDDPRREMKRLKNFIHEHLEEEAQNIQEEMAKEGPST